jgi:predicted nucleic acid-binding protein
LTVVVDASLVIAAATDGGSRGKWSRSVLASGDLHAPHLLGFEAASVLRRLTMQAVLVPLEARQALEDILDLPIELAPMAPFASRIWALRDNIGAYDAAYVALAEILSAPLATLDRRLAHAPGAACRFLLPD